MAIGGGRNEGIRLGRNRAPRSGVARGVAGVKRVLVTRRVEGVLVARGVKGVLTAERVGVIPAFQRLGSGLLGGGREEGIGGLGCRAKGQGLVKRLCGRLE